MRTNSKNAPHTSNGARYFAFDEFDERAGDWARRKIKVDGRSRRWVAADLVYAQGGVDDFAASTFRGEVRAWGSPRPSQREAHRLPLTAPAAPARGSVHPSGQGEPVREGVAGHPLAGSTPPENWGAGKTAADYDGEPARFSAHRPRVSEADAAFMFGAPTDNREQARRMDEIEAAYDPAPRIYRGHVDQAPLHSRSVQAQRDEWRRNNPDPLPPDAVEKKEAWLSEDVCRITHWERMRQLCDKDAEERNARAMRAHEMAITAQAQRHQQALAVMEADREHQAKRADENHQQDLARLKFQADQMAASQKAASDAQVAALQAQVEIAERAADDARDEVDEAAAAAAAAAAEPPAADDAPKDVQSMILGHLKENPDILKDLIRMVTGKGNAEGGEPPPVLSGSLDE